MDMTHLFVQENSLPGEILLEFKWKSYYNLLKEYTQTRTWIWIEIGEKRCQTYSFLILIRFVIVCVQSWWC